jgi:hypothetical protein
MDFEISSPEELDAPLEFLYYLYILSNTTGKALPPPLRLIISAAEAADFIAVNAEALDRSRGPRRFSGAMSTPEILAYEHSSLGSTRII